MKALSATIDVRGDLGAVVLPRFMGPAGPALLAQAKQAGVDFNLHVAAMGEALDLYYLWSVERVGVLYGRKNIAGKEWYPWGARLLLAAQNGNGGWGKGGSYISTPAVDTCFALLFLKRANLVKDLSAKLELLTGDKNAGPVSPGPVERKEPQR
jgi:hypothetical protein